MFNGKSNCCNSTFTDVLFTLLLAKNTISDRAAKPPLSCVCIQMCFFIFYQINIHTGSHVRSISDCKSLGWKRLIVLYGVVLPVKAPCCLSAVNNAVLGRQSPRSYELQRQIDGTITPVTPGILHVVGTDHQSTFTADVCTLTH